MTGWTLAPIHFSTSHLLSVAFMTSHNTRRSLTHSGLIFSLLSFVFLVTSARAQERSDATTVSGGVEFFGPDGFGPSAIVEEFEGIVGDDLPSEGGGSPFSIPATFPFPLDSGVQITNGPPGDVVFYEGLLDNPPGSIGWGLGQDENGNNHDLSSLTTIPSGTGWLAAYIEGTAPPVVFTFETPVYQVGSFVESGQSPGDGPIILEAFDVGGASLGSVSVETDGVFYDNELDSWIGLSSDFAIGSVAFHQLIFVLDDLTFESTPPTGIEGDGLPATFALIGAYPNPFNPSTTVQYYTPESVNVRLEVFDLLGRPVELLVDGRVGAGSHSVQWDAANVASGAYLVRMQAGDFVQVQRLTLLK